MGKNSGGKSTKDRRAKKNKLKLLDAAKNIPGISKLDSEHISILNNLEGSFNITMRFLTELLSANSTIELNTNLSPTPDVYDGFLKAFTDVNENVSSDLPTEVARIVDQTLQESEILYNKKMSSNESSLSELKKRFLEKFQLISTGFKAFGGDSAKPLSKRPQIRNSFSGASMLRQSKARYTHSINLESEQKPKSNTKTTERTDRYFAELLYNSDVLKLVLEGLLEDVRNSKKYHQDCLSIMKENMTSIGSAFFDFQMSRVCNISLEEQKSIFKNEISIVLKTCLEHLYHNDGLRLENIFQISGKPEVMDLLMARINSGKISVGEFGQELYSIACFVKSYLFFLPVSLLDIEENLNGVDLEKLTFDDQRFQQLVQKVKELPDVYLKNLLYILSFLVEVNSNSEFNKMSSKALAECMTPSLIGFCIDSKILQKTKTFSILVEYLITNFEEIFPEEYKNSPFRVETVNTEANKSKMLADEPANVIEL